MRRVVMLSCASVVALGLLGLTRQAPTRVVVPDEVNCGTCAITSRTLFTLESGITFGDAGLPSAIRVDNAGRIWVLAGAQPPMVFGPTGKFIKTLGRPGAGPGEFVRPGDVFTVADSVVVLDAGAVRATIVGPDLDVVRSLVLPFALRAGAVHRWPDSVILSGSVPSSRRAGWPIHILSFASSPARILHSFGPGDGELTPEGLVAPQYVLPARNGLVWAGGRNSYELSLWSPLGQARKSLLREPAWFRGPSGFGTGSPTVAPPSRAVAIVEDQSGLIWSYVSVAAPDWKRAWSRVPAGAREVPSTQVDYEHLYQTMIEVLDPISGRVVARTQTSDFIVSVLTGNRPVSFSVGVNGFPVLKVVSLTLSGR